MRVTQENIENLLIESIDKHILKALLEDLEEINNSLPLRTPNIFIEWQDWHNKYSVERTEPCPDYYGYYRLIQGGKYLGMEMDLETLDYVLCVLRDIFINDD